MSYSLLNQSDIEHTFTDILQIAEIIENVSINRRLSTERADAGKESEKASGAVLAIAPVLALPPSCDAETVKKISNIGRGLTILVNRLRRQIDNHLVEFFAHEKKKELGVLEEISSKRQIIPRGFLSQTQAVGMKVTGSSTFPFGTDAFCEHEVKGGGTLGKAPANDTAAQCMLASATGCEGGTGSSAHQTISGMGSSGSGVFSSRNAPLARKLKERRDAASTLQSFLFLILESCIARCDATCASIFTNGLPFKPKTSRQPHLGVSRNRDTSSKLANEEKLQLECLMPETDLNDAPRFLHCIANLFGEGKFPNEVSWAVTNPLTSVVQSGVALNLRNTEAPQLPSLSDRSQQSGNLEDAATESIHKSARRLLNINNGLILPLGDFGCVVVANKKSLGGVRSFTVSDEHVLWGASLVISTVLTRYQKDLLLDNSWFPCHIPCLQRFVTFPTTGDRGRLGTTKKAPTDAFSSRLHISAELESAVTNSFGSLATGVLKFISEARGESMPLRLTVVRTADPSLIHAVPGDLIAPRRSGGTVDQVTEEEIFQGAAEYITHLESLWHKTLGDNNAAHLLMNNYDKEIEARNEEIRSLEAKMRALNIKIVQLERQRRRS